MLDGSDPEFGSVRPKHPIASPAAIWGSHSCFCSSEPYLQIGNMARDPWTGHHAAQTRIAGFEFHAGDAVVDRRGSRAPIPFEVHAEKTQFADLESDFSGKDALFEPLGDVGEDPVAHKLLDGVAQQALLGAVQAVDYRENLWARGWVGRYQTAFVADLNRCSSLILAASARGITKSCGWGWVVRRRPLFRGSSSQLGFRL